MGSSAKASGGRALEPTAGHQRLCSECPTVFTSERSDKLTCSSRCRGRRSRRMKQRKQIPREHRVRMARFEEASTAVADHGAIDIAREIMRDELRPIVREALNEKVLTAISDLVSLTPLMVDALREEMLGVPLQDPDTRLPIMHEGKQIRAVDYDRRLRAVQLLAKYTVGAEGLRPGPDKGKQEINVQFGDMPRPDYDAEPEPPRTCSACGMDRAANQFVGDSSRCERCHAELREHAQHVAGDD